MTLNYNRKLYVPVSYKIDSQVDQYQLRMLPEEEQRILQRRDVYDTQTRKLRTEYKTHSYKNELTLARKEWDYMKEVEKDPITKVVLKAPTHARGEAPLSVVGYGCGTCRMGDDPATSVVNADGQCHELDNLFIADASIFPSCPSVGPGLTVIALALRLADKLG